jgi:hypothetical protein
VLEYPDGYYPAGHETNGRGSDDIGSWVNIAIIVLVVIVLVLAMVRRGGSGGGGGGG